MLLAATHGVHITARGKHRWRTGEESGLAVPTPRSRSKVGMICLSFPSDCVHSRGEAARSAWVVWLACLMRVKVGARNSARAGRGQSLTPTNEAFPPLYVLLNPLLSLPKSDHGDSLRLVRPLRSTEATASVYSKEYVCLGVPRYILQFASSLRLNERHVSHRYFVGHWRSTSGFEYRVELTVMKSLLLECWYR